MVPLPASSSAPAIKPSDALDIDSDVFGSTSEVGSAPPVEALTHTDKRWRFDDRIDGENQFFGQP
jgi:hypothetical protein